MKPAQRSRPASTARVDQKLPIIAFGLGLIAVIWLAVGLQIRSEYTGMVRTIAHETSNLALVFEQSVGRTASEIDRILRYLRTSHERGGFKSNWPELVQEEFTANKHTVQIAAIGEDGTLITSSRMLYPSKRIDLSDREHFRVHTPRSGDRLFISKPVLGRASGQWSVQFTRPFDDAAGQFAGVLVVSLDPHFLTESFSALELGGKGGLALVGDDGTVRAASGIYGRLLGEAMPELVTEARLESITGGSELYKASSPEGPSITAIRRIAGFPLSVTITRANASLHVAWLENRRNYILGASILTLIVLAVMASSVNRRRLFERQLTHLATHDALTRLANRREFEAQLEHLLADPQRAASATLHLIDLDRFKEINDYHGHQAGDKALAEIGRRLRAAVRRNDIVARIGGDEFAVLQLEAGTPEAAESLARRMCTEVEQPLVIDGKRLEVGASIGSTVTCDGFDDLIHLMRSADLALYAAKEAGRGRYRFFEPELDEKAKARREVEQGLKRALAEGHLEIFYQPFNDIATGAVTGYEALVRWRHPERGLVSPGEFIPIAEQTGLIVELGSWVLHRACRDLAERSDELKIAVNVSAIEFRTSDVVATVRSALAASSLAADRLELEITESLLLERGDGTVRQLQALKDLGVKIAIDDFGTGYSSLSYLQDYPIDCVKIDRSFVQRMCEPGNAHAIIRAISSLADSMGISTIAEGVETRAQLSALADIGCHEAQGFLFSPPRPADEILPPPRMAHRIVASRKVA